MQDGMRRAAASWSGTATYACLAAMGALCASSFISRNERKKRNAERSQPAASRTLGCKKSMAGN